MKKVVTCNDCGGVVSKSAQSCPHCGAKQKAKTSGLTWFALVLVLFAAYLFFIAGTQQTSSSATSASDRVADDATRLCIALKNAGATACDVDFNATEPSYVDVTINAHAGLGAGYCSEIAKTAQKNGITLRTQNRPWELRVFTPTSVRAVATCSLR